MHKTSPELLLQQINEVLRAMPAQTHFFAQSHENSIWIGQAAAVVHLWDSFRAVAKFDPAVTFLRHPERRLVMEGYEAVLSLLHQARHELAIQTSTPLSVGFEKGAVFDYFDELRKTIQTSKKDLFFIDPYIDADFVTRYLPHVPQGVAIRLLGRNNMPALLSAVSVFKLQSGLSIEVRASGSMHDRYLIIDGAHGYQSGASFSAVAKKSSTTLTEVLDAFPAIQSTYETLWLAASAQP